MAPVSHQFKGQETTINRDNATIEHKINIILTENHTIKNMEVDDQPEERANFILSTKTLKLEAYNFFLKTSWNAEKTGIHWRIKKIKIVLWAQR